MRFMMRSLSGLMLVAVTLGLLGFAVGIVRQAVQDREAAATGQDPAAERVYAVNVATLTEESATPVLTAYGDLLSARLLELRAGTGGTLTELAPGFRDGGEVAAGEVLWRLDPAEAQTALALAGSDLDAALAEEEEARIGLELAGEERAAAERQLDLRRLALARAEDLSDRGVGTAADLEVAQLALSTAEQVLTGRRLAFAEAKARIGRAAIATARATIARDEAARVLANTVERAPFAGVLADVTAVPGRRVAANEQLGLLIDPTALEVVFRISNAEFARLADASGTLPSLPVVASLEIDGIALPAPGRIDRTGVSAVAAQPGRLIYARLDPDRSGLLRPGDFVSVRVDEPTLEGVAVVPSTAVSPEGQLLLVDADDRLEAISVEVVRRQGDAIILADVPFGREYVTERLPQIGPGVRVRRVAPGPEAAAEVGRADDDARPTAMVQLSPEKRAGLIAVVEASKQFPEADKARLLAALQTGSVPQAVVDRLEAHAESGG